MQVVYQFSTEAGFVLISVLDNVIMFGISQNTVATGDVTDNLAK